MIFYIELLTVDLDDVILLNWIYYAWNTNPPLHQPKTLPIFISISISANKLLILVFN